MESFEKWMVGLIGSFILFVCFMVYAGVEKDKMELELKYMAASAGAPLAVCVK
jgi:hypothetical protein